MNANRIWTTRLPTTYKEKRRSWKKKKRGSKRKGAPAAPVKSRHRVCAI